MYIKSFPFSVSINFIVPYLFISSFSPTHLNLMILLSSSFHRFPHYKWSTFPRLPLIERIFTRGYFRLVFARGDVFILTASTTYILFSARFLSARISLSARQTCATHWRIFRPLMHPSDASPPTLQTATQMLFEHHHLRRMRRRERERRIEAILVCLF